MRVKPLLAGAVLLAVQAGARAAVPCPEPEASSEIVRLSGLDRHGDILLADGRSVRLLGLAPRQDEAEAQRFAAAIAPWVQRELQMVVLAQSDRWGRLPVRLIVPQDPPETVASDLAVVLVKAGAALRLPDMAHPGCDAALRTALAGPRQPSRPLAAATGPAPAGGALDGHDPAALKRHAGRIVVVEGRIMSIGERAQRSYLNFSRRRGEGGAVMVSRRLWREMQEAGWTSAALTGKRIRASGLLGGQDGLLLEATSLTALELID